MRYTARVEREDRWWIIRVPELRQTTQARRLEDAPLMAKECIASLLEVELDDVDVDLVIEPVAGADVTSTLAEIHRARERAAELERQASERARGLAQRLATAGVPLRDIGTILGVSYQRAHQLVTAPNLHTNDDDAEEIVEDDLSERPVVRTSGGDVVVIGARPEEADVVRAEFEARLAEERAYTAGVMGELTRSGRPSEASRTRRGLSPATDVEPPVRGDQS